MSDTNMKIFLVKVEDEAEAFVPTKWKDKFTFIELSPQAEIELLKLGLEHLTSEQAENLLKKLESL